MTRSEISDAIRRIRKGDGGHYRVIVDEYKDRLYAFLWRIVRNHHEAEDLTQATFVRAFESLDRYSDRYSFSTWLFTIGYRLTLNRLRKKRALNTEVDWDRVGAEATDTSETVASSELARDLKKRIWSAVDQLSDEQRESLILFYQENQSCKEIGEILGIPAVTVKSHLHRAREKLRDLLGSVAEEWTTIPFPLNAESA